MKIVVGDWTKVKSWFYEEVDVNSRLCLWDEHAHILALIYDAVAFSELFLNHFLNVTHFLIVNVWFILWVSYALVKLALFSAAYVFNYDFIRIFLWKGLNGLDYDWKFFPLLSILYFAFKMSIKLLEYLGGHKLNRNC